MHKRGIRIIMGYGYRKSCRELFKELKILTLSSQYILYYCSLLITGVTLPQIVYITTLIPVKDMIYTSLGYLWPCIRREFIIQASKSLMVFPRQLRTPPVSQKSLKLL
jgi:hypothetical protein